MIYAGHVKVAPGKPQTCRVKYALGLLQRDVIYKTEHFGNPTKQTACTALCMSSTDGFIPSIANQSRRSSTNQPGREQAQAR